MKMILDLLFINFTSPGPGYGMFAIWLFFLYSGIILIQSYNSPIGFIADYSTRALIGAAIIYTSLSSIYWKLVANDIL